MAAGYFSSELLFLEPLALVAVVINMPWWNVCERGLIMALAVMAAGLMRDPMRSHAVGRESYVWLLLGVVLATSLSAIAAATLDLRRARRDRFGTAIPGVLGILYLRVLWSMASHCAVVSWGCGTGKHSSWMRCEDAAVECAFIGAALVVVALLRDGDRKRAIRCMVLVPVMWFSTPFLSRVLDRDRTKPTKHLSCYANQRTIIRAIEIWELEKHQPITQLTDATFADLKAQGYLQSIPQDTDVYPPSSSNYQITDNNPRGVTCTRHGSIQ